MPQIAHFEIKKNEKAPYRGRGTPLLPPLGRYAPAGLVASLPRKDCTPKISFGSLRHCMTVNTNIPEQSKFAVCCKFGPCTITDQWRRSIFSDWGGGQNLKNANKFGALCAHGRNQKLKLCMFSGICMLNLMVCSAWQCFLNLFLHYILSHFQVVEITPQPPPPPTQDRRLCHRHVCRKNDDLYYTIPALLGRGIWITSCD